MKTIQAQVLLVVSYNKTRNVQELWNKFVHVHFQWFILNRSLRAISTSQSNCFILLYVILIITKNSYAADQLYFYTILVEFSTIYIITSINNYQSFISTVLPYLISPISRKIYILFLNFISTILTWSISTIFTPYCSLIYIALPQLVSSFEIFIFFILCN